jgi:hypothetical protein
MSASKDTKPLKFFYSLLLKLSYCSCVSRNTPKKLRNSHSEFKKGEYSLPNLLVTVDMVGSGGTFGRLNLPVVKTSPSGADVIITDQLIKITDMTAFKAFVKSIMQDDHLTLRLANGHATIKSWGLSAQILYEKDLHLKGMSGPKTTMLKTEVDGEGFRNTMAISNPSPFEIDMGIAIYGIYGEEGVKIAEQRGKTYIPRGESTLIATGRIAAKGVNPKGEAKLVGLDVEEDNWFKETIKDLNTPVILHEDFVSLCCA